MENPYKPPAVSKTPEDSGMHPDWYWMVAMCYLVNCLFMIISVGSAPSQHDVLELGHGERTVLLPLPFGPNGIVWLIPILSVIPTAVSCLIFRFRYLGVPINRSVVSTNIAMLATCFVLAVAISSFYRLIEG